MVESHDFCTFLADYREFPVERSCSAVVSLVTQCSGKKQFNDLTVIRSMWFESERNGFSGDVLFWFESVPPVWALFTQTCQARVVQYQKLVTLED